MADFTADFEAGTHSSTITTSGGEASATAWDGVSETPTYSNAQAKDGTLSALISSDDDWMWWVSSATDHYGRFYLYLTSDIGAGFTTFCTVHDTDFALSIAVYTDRKWYIGGWNVAGTTVIPLNQWVRIEYHVVHSATVWSWEAKLFTSPDSTTPDETLSQSGLNTQTQAGKIEFGSRIYSGFTTGYHLDGIVANATSYPGPIGGAVQTLLASADSVDGSWTNESGGTTLAASIDETTASDSDYIQSELAPSASGCRVKLAAGGDPASSSGHEINWRAGKNTTGGQTVNLTVKLYQGGGNSLGGGTLIADFDRNGVDAMTDYTETLSGGEADAITDYTNLYLEFHATAT